MNEMIERVAKVLYINSGMTYNNKSYWDMMARAAIEAMREPTDYQRNKYYELSFNTTVFNDGDWQRAIDSILK